MSDYTIRRFSESDIESFLELCRSVFGNSMPSDVFEWKYLNNPYVKTHPIFVAEENYSGKVVGARPHLALELENNNWTGLALQPCDTMVHQNHRHQGLFQRMTLNAVEYYRDREPSLMFNFPNEKSLPGNLKMGWKIVGNAEIQYRFNNLHAGAKQFASERAGILTRTATPLAETFFSVLDEIPLKSERNIYDSYPHSSKLDVEILSDIPASGLQWRPPDNERLHLHRGQEYFDWRFGRPSTEYIIYRLKQNDTVIALLITKPEVLEEATMLSIVDAVPAVSPETISALSGWGHLLRAAIQNNESADIIRMFSGTIPDSVAQRFGFIANTSLPLSLVSSPTKLVALPLYSAKENIAQTNMFSIENWSLPLAAWDVT
ncbi:GNAT family N-acetyltransferase [Halorubrum sp. Atlit-26R]|uniref:GNAT family N-acetyltransferase n=1 Tax=Halorubrum sp. Atlit-26R TaxID=2282128 RepID=UPI000EF1821B|nr:GNAT family N-acetyltransferase [Halorubrum sp. Atlit-26R]RLM62433.1 GNAT family N-acetyltransferase [Halorubrum sp. Atlit-26R]